MRPIIQVSDQVFRTVGCRDWIVLGDNFGGAVHHVGRLIKSNLRYQKLYYLAAFLLEEHVSTWQQVNFNKSSEEKSSRARGPLSFWVWWCWIFSCTYVARAEF